MIEFAGTYADPNTHGFPALLAAIKAGGVQRSAIVVVVLVDTVDR